MLGADYVTLKTRPQGANLAVTEMGVCKGYPFSSTNRDARFEARIGRCDAR